MPQERYFIGPGLRDKLRETITRVDGLMDRERGPGMPIVHQEMMQRGNGKVFRICTFTGAWQVGTNKTVKLKYQSETPNTVSVTNLFLPIQTTDSRDCAIAKEGTAWYLIQWQWHVNHAFTSVTAINQQIRFHTLPFAAFATVNTSSYWSLPVSMETVLSGATLSDTSLTFSRRSIGVFFPGTAATVAITVTTCSTAAQ